MRSPLSASVACCSSAASKALDFQKTADLATDRPFFIGGLVLARTQRMFGLS